MVVCFVLHTNLHIHSFKRVVTTQTTIE